MINKIHDIVLNDRKVKTREIAEIVFIWTKRVVNILHRHLCIRKLCARWVPRFLKIDQNRFHVTTSVQNLAYSNRNRKELLRRFVTMDETLIHHCTPESRKGSKEWVKPGESALKRPKTQQSIGKVMASVFWDAHGVIFIDYLEKGRTITGAYYAALLDRLVDQIRKKRPRLKEKKKSFFIMTMHYFTHRTLHRQKAWIGFWITSASTAFSRPSPQRLLSVERKTEGYFGRFDKSYYLEGIEKLKDRWTRRFELKAEYIEK